MNEKYMKHDAKTNWKKLQQASDSQINYIDNPATTDDFWKDAKLFMPVNKIHLSLRLDEDVVNFFKNQGPKYQTKINAVLKSYAKTHSGKGHI